MTFYVHQKGHEIDNHFTIILCKTNDSITCKANDAYIHALNLWTKKWYILGIVRDILRIKESNVLGKYFSTQEEQTNSNGARFCGILNAKISYKKIKKTSMNAHTAHRNSFNSR